MDLLNPISLAETGFRSLVLLLIAGGVACALRRATAQIRAGVWAAALIGSLLVPAASMILPSWNLPLVRIPDPFSARAETDETARPVLLSELSTRPGQSLPLGISSRSTVAAPLELVVEEVSFVDAVSWTQVALTAWWFGLALALLWQVIGLFRLRLLFARAAVPRDPRFARALRRTMTVAGIRRPVRLAISDQISTPVTWGTLRPIIVLPRRAETWLQERIEVVLLHELVHIHRWHWPVRMAARAAAATYWYNPCAWIALRRLKLEQELACDEEVVGLGSKPSTYASHLLEIARSGSPRLMLSGAALDLAQRQHLEGRIMAILSSKSSMKHRIAVTIFSALIMIALVPAIAAVNPWARDEADAAQLSEKRSDDRELEDVVRELSEIEEKMQPYLAGIEGISDEMAPVLAEIHEIEIDMEPLQSAMDEKLQPMLERLSEIELDMEPYHAQMEGIEEQMQPFMAQIEAIHVDMAPFIEQISGLAGRFDTFDDEELEEMIESIHDEIEPMHAMIEEIHLNMEPLQVELGKIHENLIPQHEHMERIHEEMQPFLEEMERLHLDAEVHVSGVEELHEAMAPFHERMEQFEREIEPFHEEMERVGNELEDKLEERVQSIIEARLGDVTDEGAPFDEAAERVVDMASISIDEQGLRFDASATEVREVLLDLFEGRQRAGAGEAFSAAIDSTTAAVSSFEVPVD